MNTFYDIAMICNVVAVSQRPAMTADFTVKMLTYNICIIINTNYHCKKISQWLRVKQVIFILKIWQK